MERRGGAGKYSMNRNSRTAFRPFNSFWQPIEPAVDDGRRPTVLSLFADRVKELVNGQQPAAVPETAPAEEETRTGSFAREPLIELQAILRPT